MKNKAISLSQLFWIKADCLPGYLGSIASASFLAGASNASATSVSLFDSGINVDGAVFSAAALPASVNAGAFDFGSGIGTLNVTVSGPGSHYAALFLDHEIDEEINTFFNEIAGTSGAGVITALTERSSLSATPSSLDRLKNQNAHIDLANFKKQRYERSPSGHLVNAPILFSVWIGPCTFSFPL